MGWVSEQDCIAVMLKEAYHCEQVAQVRDVMRKEVLAVGPDTSILDLAEMMMGQKPKIYPVVEEGRLLGVISRHDVMQAIHAQLAPASCIRPESEWCCLVVFKEQASGLLFHP
jgi:predicted transcriptional regulator